MYRVMRLKMKNEVARLGKGEDGDTIGLGGDLAAVVCRGA